MVNLNQTIRDGIKSLETKAEEKIKTTKNQNKTNLWRGKKLVSVNEWEIMKRKKRSQYDLLNFMPDDYVDGAFIFQSGDEKLNKQREEWWKDYHDYLEFNKGPSYGESKCRLCILYPNKLGFSESLRNVILKGIDSINPNTTFQCEVVNFFICPYEQNKNDSNYQLFSLRKLWVTIDQILNHFNSISMLNEYTYEADFEEDKVETYLDARFLGPNSWGNLEDEFSDLKASKFRMQSISEIYGALTNKDILRYFIEQYITDLEDNSKKDENKIEEIDLLRNTKDVIVDYFMSIKEKIKIEDLCDFDDRDLEGERQEEERIKKTEKWIFENDKNCNPNKLRHSKCLKCGEFANIHCVNCDIWICVNHWRSHKTDAHNPY